MKNIPWETWEEDFLREVGAKMTRDYISEKLERTPQAISDKASRLNIKLRTIPRPWTKAELSLFGKFSNREIAQATNRSLDTVKQKRLQIKNKSQDWSPDEVDLFWRNTNSQIAQITGRSEEEVGLRREQWNIERNKQFFSRGES